MDIAFWGGVVDTQATLPIGSVEEIETFPTPDALLPKTWHYVKNQISRYGQDYAIFGELGTTIFELSWNLVGLEKFIVDLLMEKPYVPVLLDKILGYSRAIGNRMVELGFDVIWAGDDFGTQQGTMISPELWRKHFKPRTQHSTGHAVGKRARLS